MPYFTIYPKRIVYQPTHVITYSLKLNDVKYHINMLTKHAIKQYIYAKYPIKTAIILPKKKEKKVSSTTLVNIVNP